MGNSFKINIYVQDVPMLEYGWGQRVNRCFSVGVVPTTILSFASESKIGLTSPDKPKPTSTRYVWLLPLNGCTNMNMWDSEPKLGSHKYCISLFTLAVPE
jgi:hypothetical protein